MSNGKGWIGVDLDGTLARYDGWKGEDHIGEPLQPMVDRIKAWRAQGQEIRIFTARASAWGRPTKRLQKNINMIQAWCMKHIGEVLPVTSEKDYSCIQIWDDRAIQVAFNEGDPVYNPNPFDKGGPLFRESGKIMAIKEQIDEAHNRIRGIREIAAVGGNPTHDETLMLALGSALSTAEQERDTLKDRERAICRTVGGVSDGGHYRADVIEHLQIVYEKAKERDVLKARCAELEARLQGTPQAYADIMAERKRQDEKWGVQRHHPTEWLSILGEEFGEVCKAVCEAHFSGYESTGKWDQYRVELIHTAAVAVSMIECHDAIVGKKEGV